MHRALLLAAAVVPPARGDYSYAQGYAYTDAPTALPTETFAPTRAETYAPTRMTEAPSYAPTTDTYAPTGVPPRFAAAPSHSERRRTGARKKLTKPPASTAASRE